MTALGNQRAMAACLYGSLAVPGRGTPTSDILSPEELEAGRLSGDEHALAALAGVRLFGEV